MASASPSNRASTGAERTLLVRLLLGALAAALVSSPVVGIVALVQGHWAPLLRLDTGTAAELHDLVSGSPAAILGLETISVVLSPTVFQLVVAAVAVLLWRRGARRLALWAGVSVATGGMLSPVLKDLVERARPVLDSPVTTAGGYSLPSGHAMGSFLASGVLLMLVRPLLSTRRRHAATAVAVGIVAVVGFDRVALGVHYVTDVVAGWLVSLAVLVGTTVAFEARSHSDALATGIGPEELDAEIAAELGPRT